MISSINCHTTKIPEYVDCHPQPVVKEIPWYVQDTTDFLRKINQIELVPDNSYLVSLDVKSLYTNILNTEGTKSVKASLESCSKRTTYFQLQKPHTDKRLRPESNLRTLIPKPRY